MPICRMSVGWLCVRKIGFWSGLWKEVEEFYAKFHATSAALVLCNDASRNLG